MPAEGIEVRHATDCRSRDGGRCTRRPTYRASVWSTRDRKRIRKSLPTEAAAKAWRQDAAGAVRRGELRAIAAPRLADAMTELLAAMDARTFRTRGRRPFKPTTRRATEQTYRLRVADRFGRVRLDRLDHLELQDFVDELDAAGTNPSTIEGTVLPLRLVFRWARARGIVAIDPTDGLELPEKSSRQRIPPSPATPPASSPPHPSLTARSGPPPCWPASAAASCSPGLGNVDLAAASSGRALLRPDVRYVRPPQVQARHPNGPNHRRPSPRTSASTLCAQAAASVSSSARARPGLSIPAVSRNEPTTSG